MAMPAAHLVSTFTQENALQLVENQYKYIRFDSLNPTFQHFKIHILNFALLYYSPAESRVSELTSVFFKHMI
jgi:hypothetical protein